jgi:hypothetical protein
MGRFTVAFIALSLLVGCWNHEVDTAGEWCERISGADLIEKYAPFWALLPNVSFSAEAIRDDFVSLLNTSLLEEVEHRAERMAWRDGTDLHIENLSTLMEIAPEGVISGWREGIDRAKRSDHPDTADRCLFGTAASLFDRVYIHSREWDQYGFNVVADNVTNLETERRERLKNPL